MKKKEEYEGQFEDDLQFLQSEKREAQEMLGNLMSPSYEWEKYVDDYETHIRDVDELFAEVRVIDKEIRQIQNWMAQVNERQSEGDL